jgi:hypothetical protein
MASRKKNTITFGLSGGESGAEADFINNSTVTIKKSEEAAPGSLVKSILNHLNGPTGSIERLAFESVPSRHTTVSGVYRPKIRLLPDEVLKRIAIQDSLVSNIVRARQNHISSFGRPRPDRFGLGFIIQPNTGTVDSLDEEGKRELSEEIKKTVALFSTCGSTEGVPEEECQTFSEYLSLAVRSAVVCGRAATEIIYVDDDHGERKFHRFVATDGGTIYRAGNDKSALQGIRQAAFSLLQDVAGKKLEKEPQPQRENIPDYTWVQVIEGREHQVFTSEEMKVYNFYAVPDVELDGYPVTPIDTVISAITTHINIVQHNKLYFQSGRASRGMLVIKSDDVTPEVTHSIKQAFNASINSVSNSWRMPVFGCGMDEDISWQAIDSAGGRDMEFQYLTDLNAREILTAFMMSPDELPGWSYLSKGTASQSLAESNNEYKLNAARDVGVRPLLHGFEDFINSHLFPLLNPKLAKQARIKLVGLDADNAEKEAVRLQQDMGLWETYDGVLERVEKKPLGKRWGGTLPLNPVIKGYMDQMFTVGTILEHFCGIEGASKDPDYAYVRDEYWFKWKEMRQMQEQAQQQAQVQAQQAQQQTGGGGGGGGGQSGGPGDGQNQTPKTPTEKQKTEAGQDVSASGGAQGQGASDLARSIDTAFDYLTKSEASLPPHHRMQLAQRRKTVEHFINGWKEDLPDALAEIINVAKHHAPKGS